MDAVDFCWIHNPATGGIAFQPVLAADEVWVKKGFAKVAVDLAAASGELGIPVASARQLPEAYVRALAARQAAAASPPPPPPPGESGGSPAPEPANARRRGTKGD